MPIVDEETWAKVQARLSEQTQSRGAARRDDLSFLVGKLFDDRGNRMGPSHAAKNGKRWRYCISSAALTGMAHNAGPIRRTAAAAIERPVLDAVNAAIAEGQQSDHAPIAMTSIAHLAEMTKPTAHGADPRTHPSHPSHHVDLFKAIERVTASETEIAIRFKYSALGEAASDSIVVPWIAPSHHRKREILQGEGASTSAARPMRHRTRDAILRSFQRAHRWLDELASDANQTTASIAAREGKSERSIRMTLSLAFVDPALTKAAIEGRSMDGIGVKRLIDLPMLWPHQWIALGLKALERR